MLGEWFYHQRIRKATAVFGTLFNNISVVRKNSSGETISQIKVPLSYAPKRDFVSRISQMEMGENQERQIAIKLPRMSFEIVAFTYDAARQLPKISSRTVPSSTGASTAQQLYNPVPYNLSFQLHVYGRSQDDCLQVVEQILPYFTPQYNVTIKPLDDFDFLEDVPIKLDGVTYSDDYEGALENRRTIIYTLDFEMKISLYKGVPTATGPILDVTTNFYNMGTNNLLTFINCLANQPTGITGTTTEDGPASTGTFKLSNTLNPIYDSAGDVIGSPFSIESGDSASFGVSTIVGTTGAWSYTPNADFFGTDTFKIATDVGQNVTEKFDITVTVSSADGDAVDDVFNWSNDGTSLVMNVSANDTFETTGTITHAVETQPNAGTVTIIDSLAGTFRWTPPSPTFTGSVTWEYRAIPTEAAQSSEVAEVTINVASPDILYPLSNTTTDPTNTIWRNNHPTYQWVANVGILMPAGSPITDMGSMFRNNPTFNDPDISSWDVSDVIEMDFMLESTDVFNQDISSWNVINVTNMSSMLQNTDAFDNGGVALNWGNKTANVLRMDYMFNNADSGIFNQDISSWNVSSVTDMTSMFRNQSVFDQDISNWSVLNASVAPGNSTPPTGFDTGTSVNWTIAEKPQWGTS